MKTYVAYNNQIQGLKEVAVTVKTVEKVAASLVHSLKKQVVSLNEYADNIERLLFRLLLFYDAKDHLFLKQNVIGSKVLIVVTGDKGLVGGLWHDVINLYLKKISDYQSVVLVGNKGKSLLEEEQKKVDKVWNGMTDIPGQNEISSIMNYVLDEFKTGELAGVDILYPQFISLAQQEPVVVSFLPFTFLWEQEEREGRVNSALGLPLFEPTKRMVFDRLLHKYITVRFREIILEAKLSELSARTVAMEHANVQTRDFISKLNLSFRKERHRVMTQRQLESFAAHKL